MISCLHCIRVARAEEESFHCSQATSVPFSKQGWDSPKPRLEKTCWAFLNATICHPNRENSWILTKESAAAWLNSFQHSSVTQMSWEKQMAFTLRHLGEPQIPNKVSNTLLLGHLQIPRFKYLSLYHEIMYGLKSKLQKWKYNKHQQTVPVYGSLHPKPLVLFALGTVKTVHVPIHTVQYAKSIL